MTLIPLLAVLLALRYVSSTSNWERAMKRTSFALALLSIAGSAIPLTAQTPTPNPGASVASGQRIRMTFTGSTPTQTQYGPIEAPPTTDKGTGAWVRGDTIAFRPEGSKDTSNTIAVGAPNIQRLDISRGLHSNAVAGLLWGGGIGLALGGVVGAAGCGKGDFIITQGECIGTTVVVLGVVGIGVGAIVGALIRTEKWTHVPGYPMAKVSIVPLPHGGVGYGLALSF
jgi:hypothetical protein